MKHTIIKEKRKSISIQLKDQNNLIIKAPYFFPNWQINKFIKEKENWIESQVNKLNLSNSYMSIPFKINENILYLGKKYLIRKTESPLMQPLTFTKDYLLINKLNEINTHEYITTQLKKLATEILLDKTHEISDRLSLIPNNIRVKSLISRWGSCSSKKNINLNWKLIHTPLEVIEYVIIHELVHLIHMNHSKNFWCTVQKYHPTYKNEKKWLNTYGSFVQTKY